MDPQLKQRLIGVTVVVALVVIFVPMFFEEKDEMTGNIAGVPPIPKEIMEQPLELPKSAEDVAPKEEETQHGSSGYRIVPLTDEAPPKKPEAEPVQQAAQSDATPPAPREEAAEFQAEEEEFAPASEKPVSSKPSKPASTLAAEKHAAGKPQPKVVKPAAEPAKAKAPAASPAPVTKKPEVTPLPPLAHPGAAEPPPLKSKPAKVTEPVPRKTEALEPAHPDNDVPDTPPFKSVSPKLAPATLPGTDMAGRLATRSPSHGEPPGKSVPAAPSVQPKPTESAQRPDLTAWVVQTGSFTSEAKAKALAEKLRQSRFPAFVERAESAGGTTYRVQVGPDLDRGRAEQLQKQIEDSVGIKGIILPHP